MRATAAEIRGWMGLRSELRDRSALGVLPRLETKSFQQARLLVGPDRGRGASRLVLALALVTVTALAVAEWQASRRAWVALSWQADLGRFSLALSNMNLDAAAEAWADAYRSAMDADRDWRGPVAVAEAWQELVRRAGNGANGSWGVRKLYLTALARAVDWADIDGVIVIGNALSDLGDLDEAERCVRLARRLATSASRDGQRSKLEALESRLNAALRQPDAESHAW